MATVSSFKYKKYIHQILNYLPGQTRLLRSETLIVSPRTGRWAFLLTDCPDFCWEFGQVQPKPVWRPDVPCSKLLLSVFSFHFQVKINDLIFTPLITPPLPCVCLHKHHSDDGLWVFHIKQKSHSMTTEILGLISNNVALPKITCVPLLTRGKHDSAWHLCHTRIYKPLCFLKSISTWV
jgi:hypothetical protein